MGENEINLGSGTLYISNPDGSYFEIGEINDTKMTIDTDNLPMYIRKITDTWEASIEVTASACEAFIQLVNSMWSLLLDCCPNKRVVHLAKHATKKRTRKKNYNRAIKILEDILNAET